MAKVRVLVVEDSATVRGRLLEILESDPDIEVVGAVDNGKDAISLCEDKRPDVMSMDMMLPVMTGLAATEYIMAHCPTPILIVSASVNRGELFRTYDALAAAAVDVLEKPRGNEPEGAWERNYLSTLKLVARIKVITHPLGRLKHRAGAYRAPAAAPPARPQHSGIEVVGIGASTGGPSAIVDILKGLPADFTLPILLVLHINEPFGVAFADWLDSQTDRPVAHAVDGQDLSEITGRVAMAPGHSHLVVRNGKLRLTKDAERHSCRPSVDVLFESLAREYGAHGAGCLLTGMGRDGAQGLLDIHKAQGLTIAQDESTSVIYGMPREAVLLGAAQHVLRIEEIGPAIASLTRDKAARGGKRR
ncbi:MAG: chemotaxis-specific protein-glutamate methyltransferase CheB [Proteobacteria bacterium]|nr:chemotaxis-specific protein-glutamate methyltransferase CheB [Pseudomonadota bacterium]